MIGAVETRSIVRLSMQVLHLSSKGRLRVGNGLCIERAFAWAGDGVRAETGDDRLREGVIVRKTLGS